MAWQDNRPSVTQLQTRLTGMVDLSDFTSGTVLSDQLAASIAWVEDVCGTKFNGSQETVLHDGNATNALVLRKKPVTSVILLTVQTPILGYIRTYQPAEIKRYEKQAFVKVFTYRLAVEQALFNTLDYQAWGTIFPPLPQAVTVQYTYGYPYYDPTANMTALDGGDKLQPTVTVTGDQRDPEELNWLANMQEAALCDAQAAFLANTARLKAGIMQSQSFDGFAAGLNPAAYGQTVADLIQRRDERLKRRRRQFYMSTVG